MNSQVRGTIVYGLISAAVVWPSAVLFALVMGWATAFKLMLWASMAGYAVLLAHWSKKPKVVLIFPLALLLGSALWPGIRGAFFFMVLGVLSWIRSGICFSQTPFRALVAETITIFGGAGLVSALSPHTAVTWSLAIWLFVLVQSLYFFLVPLPLRLKENVPFEDPFERARRHVQRILDDSC